MQAMGTGRPGADHLNVGILSLEVDRDAADQSAASDRHQDRVEVREVGQELARDSPLSGNNVWVVVGVDERGAAVLLRSERFHVRAAVIAAGLDHSGTKPANRL